MLHPTIVVVDDDTDFLTFVETLLAFAGYTVSSCRRSAIAFAYVRERLPAVLMLDIRMEHNRSGLDLLARMRADSVTAFLPVLLCSADVDMLQSYAAMYHDPRTAVLAKPFEVLDLLDALRRLQQY